MSTQLRPYVDADEDAAIALWQRTWQQAYPQIAFAERVEWWRVRWRDELVPAATIILAESGDSMRGFVTIDRATGYLDQIVVAPEVWGQGIARELIEEAKRLSPGQIALLVNQDNARAIRFYTRCGFSVTGEDVSKLSGAKLFAMRWRADT